MEGFGFDSISRQTNICNQITVPINRRECRQSSGCSDNSIHSTCIGIIKSPSLLIAQSIWCSVGLNLNLFSDNLKKKIEKVIIFKGTK